MESRHWDGGILLTLRHPRVVLDSNLRKFGIAEDKLIVSIAKSMVFAIDIARIFPKVAVIVHDQVTAKTFDILGRMFRVDLSECFRIYETDRLARKSDAVYELEEVLQELSDIYASLISLISPDTLTFPMPQLQAEAPTPGAEHRRPETLAEIYDALHNIAGRLTKVDSAVAEAVPVPPDEEAPVEAASPDT